jgi:hypothetical protein
VTFDGTNDYLSYTGNSSLADATGFFCTLRADIDNANGTQVRFWTHVSRILVERTTANKLRWQIMNTSAVVIWEATSADDWLAADGLVHHAISFNGATGVGQYYRNGVAAGFTNVTGPTTGTVQWNRAVACVMPGGPTLKLNGRLGDVWADNSFIDLSTEISNFYAGGQPVDLTGYGSPLIWFGGSHDAADWNAGTNLGSATPVFTMNGAVT